MFRLPAWILSDKLSKDCAPGGFPESMEMELPTSLVTPFCKSSLLYKPRLRWREFSDVHKLLCIPNPGLLFPEASFSDCGRCNAEGIGLKLDTETWDKLSTVSLPSERLWPSSSKTGLSKPLTDPENHQKLPIRLQRNGQWISNKLLRVKFPPWRQTKLSFRAIAFRESEFLYLTWGKFDPALSTCLIDRKSVV